ncbi:MAG: type II toxin-antitoxin system HicB family antitoxin [Candidatus Latescibacteria bacterium]|nr:type II toxin-antitoxin system HicB family antitoxin [Candidatus Latescibacterota bacterium]
MKFQTVLEPSEEGGYTVYVPSLPGCISEGETVEEALTNIREAIALYLKPVEDDWVVEESGGQEGYAMDNRVALEDHHRVF